MVPTILSFSTCHLPSFERAAFSQWFNGFLKHVSSLGLGLDNQFLRVDFRRARLLLTVVILLDSLLLFSNFSCPMVYVF